MSSLTAEQSNRLKRLAAMGSVSLAVALTVIKTIGVFLYRFVVGTVFND